MLGQIPFATFFPMTNSKAGKSPWEWAPSRAIRVKNTQPGFFFSLPYFFPALHVESQRSVGLMKYYHLDDSGKKIWLYSHWVSQITQLWHLLWRMNHTCRNRQPFRCGKGNTKVFSLKSCHPTEPFICSITHSLPLVSKGQIYLFFI